MILCPNAKINLGLTVHPRRPDGFHDIESLFVPVRELSDVLEVVHSDSFEIVCYNSPEDIPVEKNLCYKAFDLMRREYGIGNVKIFLYKNIPTGAGLGGGSSDAAFTLVALNEIFSLGLDRATLAGHAATLGSDCPFFIYNAPMIATGRGEILEPFDFDLGRFKIEVATPPIHISTPAAYRKVDEYFAQNPRENALPLAKTLKLEPREWPENLVNDFQRPIFAEYPALEELKNDFYRRGAVYSAMSGSGSAVFGLFPNLV